MEALLSYSPKTANPPFYELSLTTIIEKLEIKKNKSKGSLQ